LPVIDSTDAATHDADRFALPAFAKINLSLRVTGRRPDGYHELRTVFQTVTLHDTLTFAPRADEQIELTCDAADVPADETNLVHRAALLLRARYGLRLGARVELSKSVPAGGGLGGGSADAAVALLGLARLWRVPVKIEELRELGAQLGADVPFFFTGGTALGTGRGTEITPLPDRPETPLVVVTPGVKVSTAAAYKALNAPALTKADQPAKLPISRTLPGAARALAEETGNDFEPVVFRLEPECERARAALLRVGAYTAHLSGSGASVYGVFDSEQAQAQAAAQLAAETGWQVRACATLTRARYRAALGACADALP
jgi:4-diphosphocytidyl-2-C-methyl-D-erythritol kinase